MAAIAGALLFARGALPIDVATPSRIQPLSGAIAHAGLLAGEGARLAGASLLPVEGVSPWVGSALLASVLAAAVTVRARSSTDAQVRAGLGRWLWVAGAGALLALAGWAVYVPAPDHYSPIAQGTVNRMNVLAAIGIVILLYSCIALAAIMLARLISRSFDARTSTSLSAFRNLVLLCVALPALALGGAYLKRTASDARAWDQAASDQRALLAAMHEALPRLSAGATVYALGMPRTVGPNVPVLGTALDLTSAMRISYANPSLVGVPLQAPTTLACGARGPQAGGVGSVYGSSYLVDLRARRAVRPIARAQCASAVLASHS